MLGMSQHLLRKSLPDVALLRKLLAYNPETGSLIWKPREPTSKYNKCFNTKFAGTPAGGLTVGRPDGSNRYIVIGIRDDGAYAQYHAHRVIWKMMTGDEPPLHIDHADGDEQNLKWGNLRPATNGKNLQNAKLRKDNVSGVKGVCWDAGHKKWRAVIAANNRYYRLGRFSTIEEAEAVIARKRQELHGEFARSL